MGAMGTTAGESRADDEPGELLAAADAGAAAPAPHPAVVPASDATEVVSVRASGWAAAKATGPPWMAVRCEGIAGWIFMPVVKRQMYHPQAERGVQVLQEIGPSRLSTRIDQQS